MPRSSPSRRPSLWTVLVPVVALVVKGAVFGGAVLALLLTTHPALAGTLAAAAVLGTLLSPAPEALLTATAR